MESQLWIGKAARSGLLTHNEPLSVAAMCEPMKS
jgi:hypothetical protein